MSRRISVETRDLITGIECVYTFTRDQAERILKAAINEVISLGTEGAWVWVRNSELAITFSYGGDNAFLDRFTVLSQIKQQLVGG